MGKFAILLGPQGESVNNKYYLMWDVKYLLMAMQ